MKLVDYYDAMARVQTPQYQHATGLTRALLHAPVERFAHRHVARALANAGSIADIGCGFGGYLRGLDHVDRVFLSDVSPQMIHTAKAALAAQAPHAAVSSWTGDAAALDPRAAGTYDLVMSVGMINHLTDAQLEPTLDTLTRMAAGTVLLYYAHTGFALAPHVGRSFRREGIHYQCHSVQTLERRMKARGFRRVDTSFVFGLPVMSPLVVQTFRGTS